MEKYVIKDSMSGTYFDGGNPGFPAFGRTRDDAKRYDDRIEAVTVCTQMPMQVLWEIEEVTG